MPRGSFDKLARAEDVQVEEKIEQARMSGTWHCEKCGWRGLEPEVDDDHWCCPSCKSSHVHREAL
jgi:rubrerythrin